MKTIRVPDDTYQDLILLVSKLQAQNRTKRLGLGEAVKHLVVDARRRGQF